MTESAPRLLLAWLRDIDDEAFARLLRRRPDLVSPMPSDLDQLVYRACTTGSLLRAVEALDTAQVGVLTALTTLGVGVGDDALRTAVGAGSDGALTTGDVDGIVRRLEGSALVLRRSDGAFTWPTELESALHLGTERARMQGLSASLFSYPPHALARIAAAVAGTASAPTEAPALNRVRVQVSAIASALADQQRVRALADGLPASARDLLDRLVRDDRVAIAFPVTRGEELIDGAADENVRALLERALIVETDNPGWVFVPNEVRRALHRGPVLDPTALVRPPLPTTARGAELVDRTASAAAVECVGTVEHLLDLWEAEPATPLRTGGLGQRELHRTAGELGLPDGDAAVLVEVAEAAQLITVTNVGGSLGWTTTKEADEWRARDLPHRWWVLATAWLTSPRDSTLAGTRDPRGRLNAPLTEGTLGLGMADLRTAVLSTLADLPAGDAPGLPDLATQVRWVRPRRISEVPDVDAVRGVVEQATRLGLIAMGAVATTGRALLDGPGDGPARAADLFPPPVDTVLIQADLTAVAPGPLTAPAAAAMRLLADVESRGSATVYRFSTASIARAFEAGHQAVEVQDMLTRFSATEVPQPLRYLVDDEARRAGSLVVGSAHSYVHSKDPALLKRLLADPEAKILLLSAVDEHTLVSPARADKLRGALRDLGHTTADAGDGTPPARPSARRPPPEDATGRLLGERIEQAIRTLRELDRRVPHDADGDGSPGALVTELHERVRDRRPTWVRHYDASGALRQSMLMPTAVREGRLHGYDSSRRPVRIALHRIAGLDYDEALAGS